MRALDAKEQPSGRTWKTTDVVEESCIVARFVRLLSYVGRVASNSTQLVESLSSLYPEGTVTEECPEPWVSDHIVAVERRTGRHTSHVVWDQEWGSRLLKRRENAVAYVEWLIETGAPPHLAQHLLVRAGALATERGGLVIPGGLEAGRSTLVAGLTLAGLQYLSDELAVLDCGSHVLRPFATPIALRRSGVRSLRKHFRVPPTFRATSLTGDELYYMRARCQFPPTGEARVCYIVCAERRASIGSTLEPVGRAQALVDLAAHCLNLDRHGREGLDTLAEVVEGAECYRLTYRDVGEAVSLLLRLVEPPVQAEPVPPLSA